MTRRRLRLSSFSDDEEEEEQQNRKQQDYEMETNNEPQPLPTPNPSLPNPPEPLPISSSDSDARFIDVSDDLTSPSPPPEQRQQPAGANAMGSGCPVGDFLLRMGLNLKREWLDYCLSQIDTAIDTASKATLCFGQFLISDMNDCGAGVLPPIVDSMHLVDLPGPFVLQVDEIVNISRSLKERYQDVNAGFKRCLKFSVTDGVQRVVGLEYRPIKDLKVLAPAGFKVAICNVHIRHGLLMLVPEALEVLGGVVEELDAARQRLVEEVNKPPRGRRSRTGEVPSLATRATLAAWPPNGVNVSGATNNSNSVLGSTIGSSYDLQNTNGSVNALGQINSSVNVGHSDRSTSQVTTPFQEDGRGFNSVTSGFGNSQRNMEAVPTSAENTIPSLSSTIISDVEQMHIDAPPFTGVSSVSNEQLGDTSEHEDVHMVDELEHPLILSKDREIPFTYLASLSARWAAVKEKEPSVQGKIKCFLTGVKGFQYKQRATYELQVYVDDGSLISEILIGHNVVLKGIGCSPEEVTAALSSSDAKKVGQMKETLRQFQIFLVNFEGMMLVEINGDSVLPVAIKMNQGCPSSDAWLLMRRLKSFSSTRTPQHSPSQPIDISP